jgi:nitrite reductase/ring-hydroxylating ferredoxin subunit
VGEAHRIPLSALDERGRAVVTLAGTEVALFRDGDRVHAFANACPHEGNPLVEGELAGPTLTCAFHNWRFDLATGACLHGDAPATRYEARVAGDEILIRLN